MTRSRAASLALLALIVAGCGEGAPGQVVFGATTDMAVGFDFNRIEATVRVNGDVAQSASFSSMGGELLLPSELLVQEAPGGSRVELSIEAFLDVGKGLVLEEGKVAVVSRRVMTGVVGERALLVPVSLDDACSGVDCGAGATCAAGSCVDPFIEPAALEDHDPGWAASAPDACKDPLSAPEPAVVIGQGEDMFAPLSDGETVGVAAGNQGGHHVWLALRTRGLRQMKSALVMGGSFVGLGLELPPQSYIISLRKGEDGSCQIYGIRFQVDREAPLESVKGQALDIKVELEDRDGAGASAMKHVVIAP